MHAMNNEKGFTLIEALMATFILTIGIFTLLTMQTLEVKGNTQARGITAAANWGQYKLEEFVTTPYANVIAGLPQPAPDSRYTLAWTVNDNVLPSIPRDPITNETYLKQIQVTVTRNDFEGQKAITFNYYKQNN